MKTLVLHPGAMGDLILSLPALGLIKEQWPGDDITLAADVDYSPAIAHEYADEFISFSSLPLARLFGREDPHSQDLAFWNDFSRILSWTGSSDAAFVRRLNQIHPSVQVGAWRPAPHDSRHVSELFVASILPWLRERPDYTPPMIHPRPEDEENATNLLVDLKIDPDRGLIAIHPGAGNFIKRWPAERYRDLISRLLETTSVAVLLVEGPAETGIGCEILSMLNHNRVHCVQEVSAGILGALLARAKGFMGNDSGVSHLAGAVGARSLVLFGPTDPRNWRPQGDHVLVLRRHDRCAACRDGASSIHSCMDNLETPEVFEAFVDWCLP